jgi:hypothetical protein
MADPIGELTTKLFDLGGAAKAATALLKAFSSAAAAVAQGNAGPSAFGKTGGGATPTNLLSAVTTTLVQQAGRK